MGGMTWILSKAFVNSLSSPEREEDSSQAGNSDGGPSAPSRSTPTARGFFVSDKTIRPSNLSRFGTTFGALTESRGGELLTSFLEGFPVRTSPPLEREPESREKDPASGRKWRALSVRYDPVTHGLRIVPCLFPGDSLPFSATLPRWGTMRDGELWERATPEPFTEEKGSGFWLTPKASDDGVGESSETFVKRMGDRGEHCFQSLSSQVKYFPGPMWPTPNCEGYRSDGEVSMLAKILDREEFIMMTDRASIARRAKHFPTPRANDAEKRGNVSDDPRNGLVGLVGKFPTPTSSMSKGSSENHNRRGTQDRLDYVVEDDGKRGRLDPDWVELLMGWPKGYTRLIPLDGPRLPVFTPDWEEGTPRVTTENNHRANRLRAIGNGQVPQAVTLAWKMLSEGL